MNFNGECENMMMVVSTPHPLPHPLPTSDHDHDHNHILSIEIKATDEIIILPDVLTTVYDKIQYRKLIDTSRDIIFEYNGMQKGKIYSHRQQTIIFHKFAPNQGALTWIL